MDKHTALGRTVTILSGKSEEAIFKNLEDTLDINYFILLGDPGSGKTHSFKAASEEEQGDYLTVREYIATNGSGTGNKPLYLDALDEFRSSFKNKDLIFELTKLLTAKETRPPKFRLSCRAADWYGESDMRLFRRAFLGEDVAVITLEKLRSDEITHILKQKGISNSSSFIEKAEENGVEDFLNNPQTLIMLSEVVKGDVWPHNKTELFSLASKLLLTEHNDEHTQDECSSYTEDELLNAAGYVCSVILLSGLAGISLENNSKLDEYPSYKILNYSEVAHVRACLVKRAFILLDPNGKLFSYFHRTNAEYMAARWMNVQVENGYPLSRFIALISHDGVVFSELRGLYSWFVSLNKSSVEVLIKLDPYGVLLYGDVSGFTVETKKKLLQELCLLAEHDPWFRSFDSTLKPLGKLSEPELVGDFIDILTDDESGFHLKSLIIDAISNGPLLKEIEDCLRQIVLNPTEPQSLRGRAAEALIKVVPNGDTVVLELYRSKLCGDINSLVMRIDVIEALEAFSNQGITAVEFADLLLELLKSSQRLAIGHLYNLYDAFDIEMVTHVLDSLAENPFDDKVDWENRNEVESIYRHFVNRVLDIEQSKNSSLQIYGWLKFMYQFSSYSWHKNDKIPSLINDKYFLLSLFNAVYESLLISKEYQPRQFIRNFSDYTFYKLQFNDIASWALDKIKLNSKSVDEKLVLYEIAGLTIFNSESLSLRLFGTYFDLIQQYPDFLKIREKQCYELIPEWRFEQSISNQKYKRDKEQKELEKIHNLNATRDLMISGEHVHNLTYLARVYFNLQRRDSERFEKLSPIHRLELEASKELSKDIVAGFINLLLTTPLPNISEILGAELKRSFLYSWYIPLAGISELMAQGRMKELSSGRMESITLLYIVMLFDKRPVSLEQSIIFIHHAYPELVGDVVKRLTFGILDKQKTLLTSLSNYLFHDDNSKPWLSPFLIELLRAYPNIVSSDLSSVLQVLLKESSQLNTLEKVIQELLSSPGKIKGEQRALLLVTGYLLDSETYEAKLRDYAKSRSWVVWQLRNMIDKHTKTLVCEIELSKLVIEVTGKHFSYISRPSGTTWGSEHPWEASNLIEQQISHLSSLPGMEASKVLGELLINKDLVSFRDNLKHAAYTQMKLRKEREFRQPTIYAVIQSLKNGEPASMDELQAVIYEYLLDLQGQVKFSEKDIFHLFWNTDRYGKLVDPKVEERCRDSLLVLLEPLIRSRNITLSPEGHMASDKRVDILAFNDNHFLPIEIKRHYHSEIWTAMTKQLERFYTCHPKAEGYGIYLVIWFGKDNKMPLNPKTGQSVNSALELKEQLNSNMPQELEQRIKVFVLDVTKEF